MAAGSGGLQELVLRRPRHLSGRKVVVCMSRHLHTSASQWETRIKVLIVVIEHDQRARSSHIPLYRTMTSVVSGQRIDTEVFQVAGRRQATHIMQEQTADDGAPMSSDIKVAGHRNAVTAGGTCKLIDQIAPHLPAVCHDAQALSQRVDEAIVLANTVAVGARISSADRVGDVIHHDDADAFRRHATEVPSCLREVGH